MVSSVSDLLMVRVSFFQNVAHVTWPSHSGVIGANYVIDRATAIAMPSPNGALMDWG